jgi:hypothetical protein
MAPPHYLNYFPAKNVEAGKLGIGMKPTAGNVIKNKTESKSALAFNEDDYLPSSQPNYHWLSIYYVHTNTQGGYLHTNSYKYLCYTRYDQHKWTSRIDITQAVN